MQHKDFPMNSYKKNESKTDRMVFALNELTLIAYCAHKAHSPTAIEATCVRNPPIGSPLRELEIENTQEQKTTT